MTDKKTEIISYLKKNKMHIFYLSLLFILAFGTRAHPMIYETLFGFDPYFHIKIISNLLQTGSLPTIDYLAYWYLPDGGAPIPTQGAPFWYISAFLYHILTLGSGYSKESLIFVSKILPALYGSIVTLGMYFLGKEIFNSKEAGYVTSFITAVCPAYAYRTISGFMEEDSMGFIWFVFGFYFFVKAVKNLEFNKQTIINSFLAGLFFAILGWIWAVYMIVPMILFFYLFFTILHSAIHKTHKEIENLIKNFLITFFTFVVLIYPLNGLSWIMTSISYATMAIPGDKIFFFIGIIIAAFATMFAIYYLIKKGISDDSKKFLKTLSYLFLYFSLIVLVGLFITVPDLREEGNFIQHTVGEESVGNQFFGTKYNALVLLAYFSLALLPLYMVKKEKGHLAAIPFIWLFITLFMAWYKLQYTYVFGLTIGIAAGTLFYILMDMIKKRTNLEKGFVIFAFAILLAVGPASSSLFIPAHVPTMENNFPDYYSASLWLKANTPEDTKIVNWWNYGHPLSFYSERAVMIENRNYSVEATQASALFYVTEDLNKALEIVNEYKPTHILVDSDTFNTGYSLAQAVVRDTNPYNEYIYPFLLGQSYITPCGEENNIYYCSGLSQTLSKELVDSFPTTWTNTPNQTNPNNPRVPFYVYFSKGTPDELMVLIPRMNSTIATKLWLHEPEVMQYFEEIYHNGGIKIFKILPSAFS